MDDHNEIRKNLYARLGIDTKPKRDPVAVGTEIRRMTNKLDEIVALARPRLIMGGIRYGSDWEHEDLMKYMQEKFDDYKQTGNFEMLVDFFNFISIEGELKTHPNYHFNATDRI